MDVEARVKEIFNAWQEATSLTLLIQAEDIAALTTGTILDDLATMRQTEFTKAFVDGVTDATVKDYKAGLAKGGSWCVEPVYEDIGGGKIRCTTKAKFVPWLDDFNTEQRNEILDIFVTGERAGVYPLDQAKIVEEYFDSTHHRSVVAARTEAQKVRTAARMEGYRKSGVKYLQYISAGDDRVRPEHEARNGLIYKIKDAPYLGEYMCRCILTEADFAVEEMGMDVEVDESIILSKEDLGL